MRGLEKWLAWEVKKKFKIFLGSVCFMGVLGGYKSMKMWCKKKISF